MPLPAQADGERVVKLSSNENPLGPSPSALAALTGALGGAGEYPDDSATELKQLLAAKLGVEAGAIVVGNGSTELIGTLVRSCLLPGDTLLVAHPSFLAYERAARLQESPILTVPCGPLWGLDLAGLLEHAAPPCKLLFLSNPNNPTGTAIPLAEVERFLAALPPHMVVVIDEAYFDYAEAEPGYASAVRLLPSFPRLLVLRSFSKAYGLAGLRLGYGVGSPEVIACLNRAREPFNVNALAQLAGCAALRDGAHIRRSVAHNRTQRERLLQALSRRRLQAAPSAANFVMVDFRRPHQEVFATFLRRRLLVRPMSTYGLTQHMRITVGTSDDVGQVISTLDEVLERVAPLS